MNQDIVASLLFPEGRKQDEHVFGIVREVNADGSYQVQLNASSVTARATACCEAQVGSRVLVLIMRNGRCVATAKVVGT